MILGNFELNHPRRTFSHLPFPNIDKTELADPLYNVQGQVDGIIGVDILSEHMANGIRRNPLGLLAQATSFGWIISGGAPLEDATDSLKTIHLITTGELYAQIRKLWEVDEVEERATLSAEDQACEALYLRTVVRGENRYSVSLLLEPDARLGDSRAMERRRFICLENRFKKDPRLKESYINFMSSLVI